jgi:hypothetical protein
MRADDGNCSISGTSRKAVSEDVVDFVAALAV